MTPEQGGEGGLRGGVSTEQSRAFQVLGKGEDGKKWEVTKSMEALRKVWKVIGGCSLIFREQTRKMPASKRNLRSWDSPGRAQAEHPGACIPENVQGSRGGPSEGTKRACEPCHGAQRCERSSGLGKDGVSVRGREEPRDQRPRPGPQ